MVPKGTPEPIIERLNAEVMKALQTQDVRQKLALQGAESLGSTPAGYGEHLRKEMTRWADVVKQTGVTLDQ
jgi:tripartite-type tricarboxylate transporter receptor subunit TctC